jgi:hypothetical protein
MRSQFGKLLALDVRRPRRVDDRGARAEESVAFSFDRATGRSHVGDVGQNASSINRSAPESRPENYGWDLFEGSQRFETDARGPADSSPLLEQPRPGCSVTGGYVYCGSARASGGRYVFGDYCSGTIWSFRISDGGATDPRLFEVESLSSFGENAVGDFAVSHGGTIFRISESAADAGRLSERRVRAFSDSAVRSSWAVTEAACRSVMRLSRSSRPRFDRAAESGRRRPPTPLASTPRFNAATDESPSSTTMAPAQPVEQALERARPRLQRRYPALRPELSKGDACQWLGRVGEDADRDATGREGAQRGARFRVAPEIDGRGLR